MKRNAAKETLLGTDRDLWGEGPCPCKAGKITVFRCSPDHPWGGDAWFESDLECSTCKKTHQLVGSSNFLDKRHRLVLRKDVEEREVHQKEWRKKNETIMAMPAVRRILEQTVSAIDQARSVAAKYRLLKEYHLADGSEGTFRRHFKGSVDLTRRFSVSELPKLMSLTRTENGEIDAALADARKSWERSHIPIPNVRTGIAGLIE